METTNPTIGGDPEFFIYRKKGKDTKIISADKILPSKDSKWEISDRGEIFFDGVQGEINPRANHCRESFSNNCKYCLEEVYGLATNKYPAKQIIFAPLASIKITPKDISGADSECFRFGCSPDSNIYTDAKIDYPDGRRFMTRFSGGHIHLGFSNIKYMEHMSSPKKLYNLVKMFDYIPGIISVALSHGDEEYTRREWYGQAGTYRIQTHGIEYRTLSSFWLASPQLTSLMASLMRDAFTFVYNGLEKSIFKKISENEVRSIINKVKVRKAKDMYKNIILPYYDSISLNYRMPMQLDYVRDLIDIMIDTGYQKVFNPYNLLNYWCIREPYLYSEGHNSNYGVRRFAKDIANGYFTPKEVRNLRMVV